MRKPIETELGQIHVLNLEYIFEKKAQLIEKAVLNSKEKITVALTGGSTPKAFYQWAAECHAFDPKTLGKINWTVSDERWVGVDDPESNFGNAERLMLDALRVDAEQKNPWPIGEGDTKQAEDYLNKEFPDAFDVCFLGMGEDGHTASIFPASELLNDVEAQSNFAAVEVPGKGQRLTITPKGLSRCGRVIVIVTGSKKAGKLKEVFEGAQNHETNPVQLVKAFADKVTWLIDNAAAAELDLVKIDKYSAAS